MSKKSSFPGRLRHGVGLWLSLRTHALWAAGDTMFLVMIQYDFENVCIAMMLFLSNSGLSQGNSTPRIHVVYA
jgi:hypothetical protein